VGRLRGGSGVRVERCVGDRRGGLPFGLDVSPVALDMGGAWSVYMAHLVGALQIRTPSVRKYKIFYFCEVSVSRHLLVYRFAFHGPYGLPLGLVQLPGVR
jgi:hypothetical protein